MIAFFDWSNLRLPRVAGQKPSCLVSTLLLVLLATRPSLAQPHRTLCNQGDHGFSARLPSGISVTVGPPHTSSFAVRTCTAEILSGKRKLTVAEDVQQADLDMFGVDLNGAGPVAAFQLKKSPNTCCLSYEIYSLLGAPHLIRTLTGGFFNAADTDLDGRIEIWAEDGQAVDGLEGLPAASFDFLPTYVLRFENNRLLDATPEFAAHFDEVIQDLRAKISAPQLMDFKQSDGKLSFSTAEVERLHNLRATKIAVLEIVWNYLYSGREEDAWKSLREMWPATDLDRIHLAIAGRRRNGILTQIDGSTDPPAGKKHATIFEETAVSPAQPIDMFGPPLESSFPRHVFLDLVIDSAGKVRSVTPEAMSYVREWKFVPAQKRGHSVASRLDLSVSLMR